MLNIELYIYLSVFLCLLCCVARAAHCDLKMAPVGNFGITWWLAWGCRWVFFVWGFELSDVGLIVFFDLVGGCC